MSLRTQEEISDSVLKIFRASDQPLRLNDVGKSLGISSESEEHTLLRASFTALLQEGIIESDPRRRFRLAGTGSQSEAIGIISIHANGNARVIVDSPSEDMPEVLNLKQRFCSTALHGDTVAVALSKSKSGKKDRGEVTRIVARSQQPFEGKLEFDGEQYFVVPDDSHYLFDFCIPPSALEGAKEGDRVQCRVVDWDNQDAPPRAEVLSILRRERKYGKLFDHICKEFRLPFGFSDTLERHAAKLHSPQNGEDWSSRLDMRKRKVITIDPHDAKDFDDALSLEELENGNLLLGVHIADVSHYLESESELDIEAFRRGNSTYLVDRVVPMLPEHLSNIVCSLVPNEERLTYSVMMEVDAKSVVVNYTITESIIKSCRRYTYEEVQEIIEGTVRDEHEEFLKRLHKLSRELRSRRFRGGGIDFETSETRFKLDENGKPISAVQKQATHSTQLVEECMLLANQSISLYIKKRTKELGLQRDLPFLYRIHDDPDPDRLAEAVEFIRSLGISVPRKKITSREINQIVGQVKELPERNIINTVLLRSMAKAIYDHNNIGHFGLGFSDYSHFTSPIRRYPDVLVHRLLKEYHRDKPTASRLKHIVTLLENAGSHCSLTERNSIESERASVKLAGAIVCKDHVGEECMGIISGVTSFGVFVQLEGLGAEGLLHIREIPHSLTYDDKHHRYANKSQTIVLRVGVKLLVKIVRVNEVRREVDLTLSLVISEETGQQKSAITPETSKSDD